MNVENRTEDVGMVSLYLLVYWEYELTLPGCHTCKIQRKKKCDCVYTFIGATNSQTCNTCKQHSITCHITEPEWWNDQDRVEAHLEEQKKHLKLKRKSRDRSISSRQTSRGRSATVRSNELSMHRSSVLQSIENGF
jgi:hypothetical protein